MDGPAGLLLDWTALELEHVVITDKTVTISLRASRPVGGCPDCRHPSHRVHSRYTRRLGDLPWRGRQVRLTLRCRRFFCMSTECPRKIFVERLPEVAAAYARTTVRLHDAHRQIGFALGGEPGARLAARLSMPTSPDTLLRRIRDTAVHELPAPRVLGVDDWAFRKGSRYGTILCDLERQTVVDLLPDRESETLAAWLKARPGVEVITRDRAGAYALGARQGAPAAVQVADRWHLLGNLREALEQILDRKYRCLRDAAQSAQPAWTAALDQRSSEQPMSQGSIRISRAESRSRLRRQRRQDRYQKVVDLSRQGWGVRQIARDLKMSRRTVRRFLRAEVFPERRVRKPLPGKLDALAPYLRKRWENGCHNVAQLHRELRAQDLQCSYATVQRQMVRLGVVDTPLSDCPGAPKRPPPSPVPSPRRVSFWLVKRQDTQSEEQRRLVERLCASDEEIGDAVRLGVEFTQLVRERQADRLEDWLTKTENTEAQEMRSLAKSLRQDQQAVHEALRLPWSNGPVEGHVNRLKAIKRQMYGRANFDLLRLRVLKAS